MTPAEKRKNTIYLRSLNRLIHEIIADEPDSKVIILPKKMAEIIFDRKINKKEKGLLFGRELKIV